MIYLALNVVFSSFFVLCIKWAQRRQKDVLTIGAVNYIAAAVVAMALFLLDEQRLLTVASVATGGINGIFYFVAFFFLVSAVRWTGAASVSIVSRLSILLPLVCGIMLFGERPGVWQTIGMLLACASLLVVGRAPSDPGETTPSTAPWVLLAFFVVAGGSRIAQETFRYVCHPSERLAFSSSVFCFAALPSVGLLLLRRRRLWLSEVCIGITLGLANLSQTWLILKALETMPGVIVFPVTSAGGVLFTTLIAVWCLNERLTPAKYVGVAIATCALAMLYAVD